MRDVLHYRIQRIGRAVVKERLRERKQREQRRRIESGRPERRNRRSPNLIRHRSIEGAYRAEFRDQLATGNQACIGWWRGSNLAVAPLRSAMAGLAIGVDKQGASGHD